MGRPKRAGVEIESMEAEKTRREKAQKSYKEDSDSAAEAASEEEVAAFVDPKDKDVDFSDEDISVSEESESEWDGESSGSEYGKKKKKSPAKKAVGRGRGRKASASPAKGGKGRGRGRPPAAKNGKKAPVKRGRKDDSDESESEEESSGSEYGKKKVPVLSPKKRAAPAKASPKKKAAAAKSSPAAEGRARRGRPSSSKTYKEMSEDEIDEAVSDDDKPLNKRAKLEPKATTTKKEIPAKNKKEESESEDEDMESMEEEDEKKEEKKKEVKNNGSAKKEEKVAKDDEEEEEEEAEEVKKVENHTENNKNGNGNGAADGESDEEEEEDPATPASGDGSVDGKASELKNKTDTDYEKIVFETDKKTAKGDPWNFKIAMWNIGGIKSWIKKNGIKYLEKEDPDVMCFNEVKCNDKTKPSEVTKLEKYPHLYWSFNTENSGHSGVSVFSKTEAKSVEYGFPEKDSDSNEDKKSKQGFSNEGRLITCEYEHFYLINAYAPNSGRPEKTEKYPKGYPPKVQNGERQKFDAFFREYVQDLEKKKPVIVTGDLNVAHQEIDLANPKTSDKTAGFTKEEREGMTQLFEDTTLFDSFRALYPDQKAAYTFWSYMHNSRQKNVGWRLDYFLLSEKLRDSLCDIVNRSQVYGSDHCPIVLFLKN